MKNKFLNIVCWLTTIVVLGISCEKGPNFKEYKYPAQVPSGMSPSSGYPTTNVTISGTNFDTLKGAVKVWFGGIQATNVISATGNQIVVQVPANAVSGKVSLQVWTTKVDSVGTYTVIPPPVYKSISANRGQVGDTITVNGEKFNTDASKVKVLIGSAEAQIISLSETQLKFIIPNAPSATLTLNFNGYLVQVGLFLIGDVKITGTLIGHSGSWGNNSATTIAAAVDGNIATFVDAPTATGYVGYDVGVGKTAKIALVRYVPRTGNAQRMVNAEIRGSNDPTRASFTTLYKITQKPPEGVYTETILSSTVGYQYIYYYSPDGFCNIAEIEFIGKVQ